MKIYNIKAKPIFFAFIAIIIFFFLLCLITVAINSNSIKMTNENYTTILKECHDDPYEYLNKKITTERLYISCE